MIGQILPNNNKRCYSNFSPTFREANTPCCGNVEKARFLFMLVARIICIFFSVHEQRANAPVRAGGWPSVGWLICSALEFFLYIKICAREIKAEHSIEVARALLSFLPSYALLFVSPAMTISLPFNFKLVLVLLVAISMPLLEARPLGTRLLISSYHVELAAVKQPYVVIYVFF
jgi:hypothetical protein